MTRTSSFKRGRRWAKPIDQSTAGQAVRQPGIDPRQWVSIGIVTAGEGDEIVEFDEEEGQPMVRVLLEPTKIPVFARVSGQVAGNGEGDWHPFVEGDEVVVVIPEGNERAGCIIIGRLANGIDKFPMNSIAGQDPTTNTFAFSRRRTPKVEECAGPITFRSATSGALFSFDTAGVFTLRTGDRSVFQMSPDVIGIQGPSDADNPPEFILQMNISNRQFTLQIGDAMFNLSSGDATPEPLNILKVSDQLQISTSGNIAVEHPLTLENLINILVTVLPAVNPLVISNPAVADAIVAAGISAAASSTGWSAATLSQAAMKAAMTAQPQKITAGPTGLIANPGAMTIGLLIG